MSRTLRRPGRAPGTVNLAIALGLLVVLLPLVLHAATAAPPTAAEFSPNAKQVIKQAPPGQAASVNGTGAGATPTPTPTPTAGPKSSASPKPLASAVPENQVKQCVGPPPLRQIEDPQSPPCIAYWHGDNGGATSQGVTRDSIYVAVPTPNGFTQQYTAFQNFFNNRFQLYGRKIVFEFCKPKAGDGSQGSGSQADQQSDAANAAAGCEGKPKPFASTFYQFDNGRYFDQEMACRYKIVMVGSWEPYDSTFINRCAPYFYNYPMVSQGMFGQLGEWACARLAGRPATWADDVPLRNATRKFGVFLAPYTNDDPVARRSALAPLLDELRRCGAAVPDSQVIINPVVENSSAPGQAVDPASANNAVVQMKQANVSSIFCLCGTFPFGALARAASTNGYHPEWLASTFGNLDQVVIQELAGAPADQTRNIFGLTFTPRQINPLLEPYNAALQEGDPSIAAMTASTDYSNMTQVYRPLLLLASGLQMAGPHLTPQTFRDGLRRAVFPNPVTAIHAGAVEVERDGYTFTHDAAEWWWDNAARGPYSDDSAQAKGAICYLGGGARRRDVWPHATPAFFAASCDSGRS
jgi:hypothetical protein